MYSEYLIVQILIYFLKIEPKYSLKISSLSVRKEMINAIAISLLALSEALVQCHSREITEGISLLAFLALSEAFIESYREILHYFSRLF